MIADATTNGAVDMDEYREVLKEAAAAMIKMRLPLIVSSGKNPGGAMGDGWQKQTLDLRRAETLIDQVECPCIGARSGPGSFIAFDIDGADEQRAYAELFAGVEDVPLAPTADTGREGGVRQLWFADERLMAVGAATITYNTADGKCKTTLRIGGKVRGKVLGAYSVLPPSRHAVEVPKGSGHWQWSGKRYAWRPGCDLETLGLPKLPGPIIERLLAAHAAKGRKSPASAPAPSKPAGGDDGVHAAALAAMLGKTKAMVDNADGSKRLFCVACRAVEHDLSDAQAVATITAYAAHTPFRKPYSTSEILDRVRDAEKTVTRGSASGERVEEKDKGLSHLLADVICDDEHFAQDAGGKLYRFVGGVFVPKAEAFIRARVKRLCIDRKITKAWTRKLADEVVAFILVDAVKLWERPPLDVVNVANGLLRLADRVLLPHTPTHLSPVQIPVKYDPAATCPTIDQFVAAVFPHDARDLAYELPGWLMTPDVSVQKAVLLLGTGGNGKSAYLAMLVSFLGKANSTGLSLHKIESNRFSVARLFGKLANVCPDLPTEHLAGTSVFKALTGTDFALEGEHKFCDGFSFDPFCRLVFSANSPPRSSDASEGFFDRWLVVPFDARFRGTDAEVTRKELDARLSTPAEFSGLLNKAIEAWHNIQHRGGRLVEPASVRAAWAEFHACTDPLAVWLNQYCVDDPDAMVAMHVLRAAYGAACERAGRPSPTSKAFGHAIRRARPRLQDGQRVINGFRQRVYLGIGMRGEAMPTERDARDARDT